MQPPTIDRIYEVLHGSTEGPYRCEQDDEGCHATFFDTKLRQTYTLTATTWEALLARVEAWVVIG